MDFSKIKECFANLDKSMGARLRYVDIQGFSERRYQCCLMSLYNELFEDISKGIRAIFDINRGKIIAFFNTKETFEINKKEYPSLYRVIIEGQKITGIYSIADIDISEISEENDILDDVIGWRNGEEPKAVLSLSAEFETNIYLFFYYCINSPLISRLYIRQYIKAQTMDFDPDLVLGLYRDFFSFYLDFKSRLYKSRKKIWSDLNLFLSHNLIIPRIKVVEYTPNEVDDLWTREEDKEYHDQQIGQIDVKKIIGKYPKELDRLEEIKLILESKLELSTDGDDDVGNILSNDMENIETGGHQTKLIPRNAVAFLFRELRNKGVIKSMSDSELSIQIAYMTGYSAEQIRKSSQMTNKCKEKLKNFLSSIIKKLE